MTLLWWLIVIFGYFYVLHFGLLAKPDRAVYAYLFLWVFFPKTGQSFPVVGELGIEGLPVFTVVEAIAAFAILIQVLRRADTPWDRESERVSLKKLTSLFVFSLLFSNIIGISMTRLDLYPPVSPGPASLGGRPLVLHRFVLLTSVASALIWLFGARAFIQEMRQIEFLFMLFILSGIELAVEVVVFYYFGLFPSLSVVTPEGRFWGLSMRSKLTSAIFSMIAIYCTLYFARVKKRAGLWLLVPVFCLPIFLAFNRGALVALAISFVFFVWWSVPSKYRPFLIVLGSFLIMRLVTLNEETIAAAARELSGNVRPAEYYFALRSAYSRVAAIVRGIEVFIALPLGVGTGAVSWYMHSSIPPTVPLPPNLQTDYFYSLLLSGERFTGSHNLYVEFIVENGIFGLITLIVLFLSVLKNFASFIDTKEHEMISGRVFAAQLSVYAILIYLMIFYMVNHNPQLYFVWSLLLFLSFFLRELQFRGSALDQRVVAVEPGRGG